MSLSPETPSTARSPADMRTKSMAELGISIVTCKLFFGPPKTPRSAWLADSERLKLAGAVSISPRKMDGDLVVAPPDPEFARTEVQAKLAPGREVHEERVVLKVRDPE